MLLHSGHITACYSGHDSDIHIIHRRLELEPDPVKTVPTLFVTLLESSRTLHRAQTW